MSKRMDCSSVITSDEGNKKYAHSLGGGYCIDEKNGEKVYELDELTQFPDWQSNKDFPECVAYPVGSKEHEDGVKKAQDLIDKFTNNDSKVAQDLKNLLKDSEIHYRVLNKWDKPNGNCAFKKAQPKNQIVICIYDVHKSEAKESALAQVLAHELGHALDFSRRPEELRPKYMDGCETAADLIGASLLVNAGIDANGFSEFMGKDYEDKKAVNKDTQMFYSPDGKYRKENFDLAYEVMGNAKHKDAKPVEKKNTMADKIKELQGLSLVPRVPCTPVSKENLKGLRYLPNNSGR